MRRLTQAGGGANVKSAHAGFVVLVIVLLAAGVGIGRSIRSSSGRGLPQSGFADASRRLLGDPAAHSFTNGFHSSTGGLDHTVFAWCIDGERFLFSFSVTDETTYAVPTFREKRDVERGDRVEVFFSPTADLSRRYSCAEIDPRGRVLDYQAVFPRRFDYAWSFQTLERRAQMTAGGYAVEGSVALSELRDLGVDISDFWMGVFRADYSGDGHLAAWYSLLPPGPGEADFHRPCMFFHCLNK